MPFLGGGPPAQLKPRRTRPKRAPRPKGNPQVFGSLSASPIKRAQKQTQHRVRQAEARKPAVRAERAAPKLAPRRNPVYGPLTRADEPIVQARNQSTRKVKKAITRLPKAQQKVARAELRKSNRQNTKRAIQQAKKKRKGGGGLFDELAAASPIKMDTAVKLALGAVGQSGLAASEPGRKVFRNAVRDAQDLPASVVPSTAHLVSRAAHGDVKGVAKDLAQPYIDFAKHPLKSAEQHPLNSYLLFAGVKGGAGRAAGRTLRTGVAGKALKQAAATAREPAKVPGTGFEDVRKYSPDVTVKARQVAQEKARARKSRKLTQQAEKARQAGEDEKAAVLATRARRKNPTVASDKQVNRRVDELADANETIRKQNRARVVKQVDKTVPSKAAAHVSLTAQAITHASKEDLHAYRAQLEHEAQTLKGSRLAANRRTRKQISHALGEKKATPEKVQHAATGYQKIVKPLTDKLVESGMLERHQADRAALMSYAVRRMGAKHNGEKLVDRHGNDLSNAQIRAHMKANDVSEPGFVTHSPAPQNGYFVAQHRAPSMSREKRTGEAARKGTMDVSREALRSNAARMQGLVDAHEGFTRFIKEFGQRGQTGKIKTYQTRKQALNAAGRHNYTEAGHATGARPMVPVRVKPFAGSEKQLESLIERASSPEAAQGVLKGSLESALKGEDGPGPWTLVDAQAVKRQAEHISRLGPTDAMRAYQKTGGLFRQSVLATNPRWLTGNVAEAAMRAGVARSGPRSFVTYRKVLKELRKTDPEAAQMLEARATGGGMFGSQSKLPRRAADQFSSETTIGKAAHALHKVWQTPGPKQVAGAWHAYTRLVFDYLNKPAERVFQQAMAGKEIRTGGLMDGRVLKLSNKAVQQAAEGLRDTKEQAALGRAVDDMYGKYSKYSPSVKQSIALYTPFISWSLNAVTFLTRVLPRDHPVLTSLLASANQATEEWRKQHGLVVWMDNHAPLWLQGSIPLPNGGKQRAPNRYTPFSLASDPLGTLGDQILPQFSGTLMALKGKDWKGDPLTKGQTDPGTVTKGKAAVSALLESMIPIYSTASNIKSKGVNAALNPLYPVKPKSSSGGPGLIPQSVLDKLAPNTGQGVLPQKVVDQLAGMGG